MTDATRIMDLPENVTMQMNTGRGDGINTSYSPMDVHPNPYGHPPPSVPSMPTPTSTSTMKQSIPPVQQHLPSRDIPMDTGNLVQDPQVQANYIPPIPEDVKQTAEYMKQYDEVTHRKVNAHMKEQEKKSRMDTLYEEGQIPILVAVLFFIFHMPIVNGWIYKYFAFMKLHDIDGHFNMYGLLWQSALFGAVFYGFSKGIHVLSEI